MTDRELLELAAKAAGIEIDPIDSMHDPDEWYAWNPLNDDGDALRLAALLRFTIKIADHEIEIFDMGGECLVSIPVFDQGIDNVSGTVRRAIVRAAAEIGKQR